MRELWFVEFATRVFKRGKGNLIDLSGEEVLAQVYVWAQTGDEAVEIVRRDTELEGSKTPWNGLTGVRRMELLEGKIMNQPLREMAVGKLLSDDGSGGREIRT